ncbi:MAG: S41 family peptidase, partial [Chloroflexota bacterium]|nr:S41 family peptidase [Chloroflexota bacterium]
PVRRADGPTTLPNTTAAAGAALVAQSVDLLLDHYVDPLDRGDLYGAAYDQAVATLRASGKSPAARRPTFTGDRARDAQLFQDAYVALAEPAGPEINQTVLAHEAIRGIVERVDECHTYFLEPRRYQEAIAEQRGERENYGGIGATIRNTQPTTIGEVYPGTPAEGIGLRRGDAILAVNGEDVSTLTPDEVAGRVRGPQGSQVTLTFQRQGEAEPRTVTATRAQITRPIFTSQIMDGPNGTKIGYMKLYVFSPGAERELQGALERFDREGVDGWILDLRDNPGGLITVLQEINSRFIKDGQPLGYRIARGEPEDPVGTNGRRFFQRQKPMALLINEGSGSSSEATAAAAQDYGYARLFGETSSGCLAVSRLYALADGSGLSITEEKYLSPQRREINRVGVTPDEVVPENRATAEDPILEAAKRWLATQR